MKRRVHFAKYDTGRLKSSEFQNLVGCGCKTISHEGRWIVGKNCHCDGSRIDTSIKKLVIRKR